MSHRISGRPEAVHAQDVVQPAKRFSLSTLLEFTVICQQVQRTVSLELTSALAAPELTSHPVP